MMETFRNDRSLLAPALKALAEELPAGRRASELSSLSHQLSSGDMATSTLPASWLCTVADRVASPSDALRASQWMDGVAKESLLRERRRRVLIYPCVVLGLSLALAFFLAKVVIVPFDKMIGEFGLQVPVPTAILLYLSQQVDQHPLRLALIVGGLLIGFFLLSRMWRRYALFTRVLGPLSAGNSSAVSAIAILTRSLAELLATGENLADAIELAGANCGHRHYDRVMQKLATQLRDADVPPHLAYESRSLPANVVHAISPPNGEQPQVSLLRELSVMYSERALARSELSAEVFGVVAVLFVGLFVGFVVIALFMPLVSLVSGLL
jgi:type IV pilus assembly protein PilC